MATSLVPDTSVTLLRDLADSQHVRWSLFYSRYQPMMAAYLQTRFPALDADDIIQETFAALVAILPRYVYNPQENGCFHNYLTGILRNKALKVLAAKQRADALTQKVLAEPDLAETLSETEYKAWREAVYEIALQQFLADGTIHERTKQMFTRLVIDGEKPEAVAEAFCVSCNTVVKMKERALKRLRAYVEAMKSV